MVENFFRMKRQSSNVFQIYFQSDWTKFRFSIQLESDGDAVNGNERACSFEMV